MKRYNTLLNLEFNALFLPLCVLTGVMAVIEAILFGMALWYVDVEAPFAYLLDSSGIPIVFALAFAALLMLISLRFAQNYAPSKSIYALLTLPVRREQVYLAKLSASLLAGFCIVAAQLALLLLALAAFKNIPVFSWHPPVYRGNGKSAMLYLALLDSRFLRMLFPPDVFSLAFSLSVLCGVVCLALSVSAQARSGQTARVVITAAVWLLLVLVTFPLADYKLLQSILKLAALVIFPFSVSIRGMSVFKSGEVAA